MMLIFNKFVCGNYPKKLCKSVHRIDADDLTQIVLKTSQSIRDSIQADRDKFGKTVQESVGPATLTALEEERAKIEEKKDRLHQNYLRRKANGKQKEYEQRYSERRKSRMKEKKAKIKFLSIPCIECKRKREQHKEYWQWECLK